MQTKKILITGASSDIGFKIVSDLIDSNYKIYGHYFNNSSNLETLKQSNKNLHLHQANLSDDLEAQKLVNDANNTLDGIDILINMIGPFEHIDLLDLTPSQWRKMIELNLNVTFSVSHYACNYLKHKNAQIINFCYAGVENIRSWTGATHYAAAKAGVAILTKSLAVSLGRFGTRVNAICPGYIDFGKFPAGTDTKVIPQIPQARFGHAYEVVQAVKALLENTPQYMTGSLISVAGAWEHVDEIPHKIS